MERVNVEGVAIAFETRGSGEPLLLLTGLGGVGRAWGDTIELFAGAFRTIVPDHRGTGESSKPESDYTIEALAHDMAGLVRAIGCGPAHVVGSSTGGALAQVMALDHRDVVESITLVSSWAGPEPYFDRQFQVRRAILKTEGRVAYTQASALFLFSPEYAHAHPDAVSQWIESATSGEANVEIMVQRIDMILAHDQRRRLSELNVPCLVLVGNQDICTPPYAAAELHELIPGAQLQVLPGGHLIYKEQPEMFVSMVKRFIDTVS